MTRQNANINKETFSFICLQLGISSSFLAQKTGHSEEKINLWLDTSNDIFPTINQAKKIAKVLRIPFAGLYMNKENLPVQKLPQLRDLRTLPNSGKVDNSLLNLAVAELIRYHDFLLSSESEMDIIATPLLLPVIPPSTTVSKYARIIRNFFDISLDDQFNSASTRKFYLYVRQKIENKGIFVHCFTGVDVEIVRGISIYNDITPIIGINSNDRSPAKIFTIIHELVHILNKQSTLCNEMSTPFSRFNEEVFCNAVAGEVLVPVASLNNYINTHSIHDISLNDIETISNEFSISKEVVIRRLLDTNHFSQNEYDYFANIIHQNFLKQLENEKLARQENSKQHFYRSICRDAIDKTSSTICRILLLGYSDGYFSKQDVSGYLGIKEQHIPKFLSEVAKW